MNCGRTVWNPKVSTLKGSEASLSHFVYLVSSSINAYFSYFMAGYFLDSIRLSRNSLYYIDFILLQLFLSAWIECMCLSPLIKVTNIFESSLDVRLCFGPEGPSKAVSRCGSCCRVCTDWCWRRLTLHLVGHPPVSVMPVESSIWGFSL